MRVTLIYFKAYALFLTRADLPSTDVCLRKQSKYQVDTTFSVSFRTESVVQTHLLTFDLKIRNKQHLIYFLLKLCQTAKKFKIYDHISGKVTMIDFYICKQ